MNASEVKEKMKIHPITKKFEEEARALILAGLEERFGFIDPAYNPDLKNILQSYSRQGTVFLVGVCNSQVMCTGAVSYEAPGIGRVERMSVSKNFRRAGIARIMLGQLELWAKQVGYRQLVLETNSNWRSAVEFYKNRQYILDVDDGTNSHFTKNLE